MMINIEWKELEILTESGNPSWTKSQFFLVPLRSLRPARYGGYTRPTFQTESSLGPTNQMKVNSANRKKKKKQKRKQKKEITKETTRLLETEGTLKVRQI